VFDRIKNSWPARNLLSSRASRGIVVEIYGKPDCHLCEVAKAKLLRLQHKLGFQLHEVNIAESDQLLQEMGTRIPLIRIDGRLACKYFVEEKAFLTKLAEAAALRQRQITALQEDHENGKSPR